MHVHMRNAVDVHILLNITTCGERIMKAIERRSGAEVMTGLQALVEKGSGQA
jgi:hypothetical protein